MCSIVSKYTVSNSIYTAVVKLTLAVVNMDDCIPVLQCLGNTTNETLRAFRGCVDGNKVKRALGSRHIDVDAEKVSIGEKCDIAGVLCRIGVDFVATANGSPHCGLWVAGVEILRRS